MKHLIQYILITFFSIISVKAQHTISGKVLSNTNEEIPFANVILYDASSQQLVKGAISTENGSYTLENVIKGAYYIEVSTLGFKNKKTPLFQISYEDLKRDFILDHDSLDEVVIISRRPIIRQTSEKLTIDFQKTELINTNLRDVMKKIPGVTITNNNLSYAGRSNIRILIDGKNTDYLDVSSLMREIPANNISKVELINQPGAEYDAEGSGPLINIVLKKNAKLGTNGSIQTTTAYTNDFNYGTNASFSQYKNDLNFQASVGFSESSWREDLLIKRKVENERFKQSSITPENILSYTSSIGINYDINEKNRIGVSGRGLYSISNRNTENLTTVTSQSSSDRLLTDNLFDSDRVNFNINPYYELNSGNNKLIVAFNYVNYTDTNENSLIQVEESTIDYLNRKYLQDVSYDILTYKADYGNNSDNINWGVGSKFTDVSSQSNLQSFIENSEGGFIENQDQSNNFTLNESIFALYGTLDFTIGEWKSNFGLRWEKSKTEGITEPQGITNVREISELFPSISLSRKLNDNLGLNIAYNRRIERPAYNSLNAFVLFYDAFTFEKGNPQLKPSFTNNYEIGLTYKEQPFFSVSYGRTVDVLFQVLSQNDETAEIARTTVNLADNQFWNIKLFTSLKFIENVDGFVGVNINNNKFTSESLVPIFDENKWAATFFLNTSYEFPWNINSEISASYTTGGLEGQVEYKNLASLDIALSKTFFNKRLKATMQFADIINPPFLGTLNYDNLNLDIDNNGVGQNFYLKLSYNFGFKPKDNKSRENISKDEEDRI